MAALFDIDRSIITKHLWNNFDSAELILDQVCAKFTQVADSGKTLNKILQSLCYHLSRLSRQFHLRHSIPPINLVI